MSDLSENPRYRLRNGKSIAGYMRKISDRMTLYSRDAYWWTGHEIYYQDIDEWVGLKDKNNSFIYEWDIVNFKIDPTEDTVSKGVVLWEANSESFGIKAIEEGHFFPLDVNGVKMFNGRDLKVYSHLFLNPDLQDFLGVKD